MDKIETCFDVSGRTFHAELPPDQLPHVGDDLLLAGQTSRRDELVVTQVHRTYDLDEGRLAFVYVVAEPRVAQPRRRT